MSKQVVVTKSVTYTMFPVFVVLLVLKLFGVINIGWFWVFLPILIGPILIFAFLGFVLVCLLLAALMAFIVGLFS